MEKTRNNYATPHPITQHIRCGLTPLPFGTLPSATSYMLGTLCVHLRKTISLVTKLTNGVLYETDT